MSDAEQLRAKPANAAHRPEACRRAARLGDGRRPVGADAELRGREPERALRPRRTSPACARASLAPLRQECRGGGALEPADVDAGDRGPGARRSRSPRTAQAAPTASRRTSAAAMATRRAGSAGAARRRVVRETLVAPEDTGREG